MMKMNNKGFAISSLLFGLLLVAFLIVSLLMSIIQTNRQNTTDLIDKIEEELGRYSKTETNFSFTTEGTSQEYIVPYGKSGWYKIELWGASKKDDQNLKSDEGRGANLTAKVYLRENQHLYFKLGAIGNNSKGGGATVVYTRADSQMDVFMVAAGGGNGAETGTNKPGGYSSIATSFAYVVGVSGWNDGGSYISGYPGVTAGGLTPKTPQSQAKFTKYDNFGGETTYKPSVAMKYIIPGVHVGTGKATIELVSEPDVLPDASGFDPDGEGNDKLPASKNMKDATTAILPANKVYGIRFCVRNMVEGKNNGGKELFKEIQLIKADGTNHLYQNDKVSAGRAAKNHATDLDSKTRPKDSATNIYLLDDGEYTSITRTSNFTSRGSGANKVVSHCVEYNPNSAITGNWVEAAAIPDVSSEMIKETDGDYTYYTVEVKYTNGTNKWTTVKSIRTLTSEQKKNGIKISNYEMSYNDTIPAGNYFITTRANYVRAITAKDDSEKNATVEYYEAAKNQKWLIQQVGTGNDNGVTRPIYKIVDNQNNNALQPHDQGKEIGEALSTYDGPYTGKEWQHWYVIKQDNGYYQIKSVAAQTGLGLGLPNFTHSRNLCIERNSNNTLLNLEECAATGNDTTGNGTQWFKLNPIDY